MITESPWVVIHTASGMVQAGIIKGRLETEGISTCLRYEAAGPIYAITIDGLGEVKILVPEEEATRAREVLTRSYDEDDLHWNNGVSYE